MSSLPIGSASELPPWSLISDSTAQTTSTSNESTAASTASTAMLTALDIRLQSLEWRPSLSYPQTPSDTLDVLHEFVESWDDDMLLYAAADEDGGVGPMMALLGPSSASPHHARQVHMQNPVASSKSYVTARDASSASSSSGSDKGAAAFQHEDDDGAKKTAVATAKAAATPGRKRIRRKVEIAQLRDEKVFLEKQLYELREYWKNAPAMLQQHAAVNNNSSSDSSTAIVGAEPRWKQIAHRQKNLLTESEHKNQRLRAEYTLQRKVARKLRKIVMKRATSPTGFDSALYQFKPRDLLLVFAESHQTFQRLLHDTEPMIGELAGIERFMTSRSQQSETFRDWQVHEDPLNTRFMDLVDSYVLPFDHVQVNKAMRRLYSENNTTNCDKHFTEHFQSSDDGRICRQVIHAYSNDQRSGHVRHREAVRHFNDATQSILLAITLIQPVTASGEPIRAVTLREQKWTIVRNDAPVNGRATAAGGTSTVQTYHKITQESVEDDYKNFWTRTMLLEGMMPMWNASLDVIRRRLECFLIEQGLNNSRRVAH